MGGGKGGREEESERKEVTLETSWEGLTDKGAASSSYQARSGEEREREREGGGGEGEKLNKGD